MAAASSAERIVVGVDGSDESSSALSWAADEARRRGAFLSIRYVFPALVSLFGSTAHEYFPQVESEAGERLKQLLESAPSLDGIDHDAVAEPGNPSEVLVEESKNASLVVVGSRGRGGMRGILLGSVSTHVAQLAHCPVVVVRHGGAT